MFGLSYANYYKYFEITADNFFLSAAQEQIFLGKLASD